MGQQFVPKYYSPLSIKYLKRQQSNMKNKQKFIKTNNKRETDENPQNCQFQNSSKVIEIVKRPNVFEKLFENASDRIQKLNLRIVEQKQKDVVNLTFTPRTNRKKNNAFNNTMLERGHLFLQQRRKHKINYEQQRIRQQMKQCTFQPKINKVKPSTANNKNPIQKMHIFNKLSQHKATTPSKLKQQNTISSAKIYLKSKLMIIIV